MMAIVGVLYNRALFAKLHLSIPTSLAAFEAACAKVRAAGDIPLGLGNADGWVGDDWYLTLVNALAGPASLVPEQHLDPHFSFSGPAYLQRARYCKVGPTSATSRPSSAAWMRRMGSPPSSRARRRWH